MTSKCVFFIELEAFKHGHSEDYLLKELAIIDASRSMRMLHYLFRAPCEWQMLTTDQKRTYNYIRRHLHKLSWNEGIMRFCPTCINADIQRWFAPPTDAVFYTMGAEKTAFLKSIFPNLNIINYAAVFNISLIGLPESPRNLVCHYRDHGDHCATLKCVRLCIHYHFCR